ncbi:spondin-1-like isoform X1 [Penaeus japonicus]|uniref:spondin-1-like isoform X1 n=1 Tax=Penaeus japonicus TaxID=27405 RepID=UPI001C712E6F|nr:spondin-1-like isoform X1 [Penaeus japonicus]
MKWAWLWACLWAVLVPAGLATKCRRSPLSTNAPKTPGDNSFKISISGNPSKYFPGEVYTVSLQGWRTQYSVQKFIGFMLVVEPSHSPVDIFGPQSVGTFQLYGDALTMHSDDCPNAVTQTSSILKSEIQVLWTAPPADSGCVTFRATVVETRDVWYMDDGELTKELCEEMQESKNKQPEIIHDCFACDEAKYEVTFEGLWSRHTHPKDFPTNEWLTHFSDIIGASHSANYRVWKYGGYASDGLRQVAEWGSTRALESELKTKSDHIRTIIKARGLWYPNVNGKTFAVFRVDNRHHLMSLVSMLGPSPDWIVGVSALELCLRNGSWLNEKTLNLYPWDAGTDSGATYEAANAPTIPREKIRRITTSYPNDPKSPFYDPSGQDMKPLARITITRQRVYEKSCSETPGPYEDDDIPGGFEESDEDANRPECQVTSWSPFSACSASCGKGLRMRTRSYLMSVKADMMGCRRQLEEKEMCSALQPTCPFGGFQGTGDEYLPDFNRMCATSEWSPWTSCPVTCGKSLRMRSRRYEKHMDRKKCSKELVEKEPCMADILECDEPEEQISPDCAVTQWNDWSPCTRTCGEGTTSRHRVPLVLGFEHCNVKTNEVKKCSERINCNIHPSEREEVCMQEKEEGPCRAVLKRFYYNVDHQQCRQFTYGGCRGNRNNFETYDECARACEFKPHPDAALTIRPTIPTRNRVADVDCQVSEWSEWSACSKTCGKGWVTRTREIRVFPQHGGRPCPKKLRRRHKCTNPKCNDGYNGLQSMSLHREEALEPYHEDSHSYQEPYRAYPETSHHLRPETDPAYAQTSHHLYPETNQAFREPEEPYQESYHSYQSGYQPPVQEQGPDHPFPTTSSYYPYEYLAPSLFNPPPLGAAAEDTRPAVDDGEKVDCAMGEWGPWSPCTHSCGSEALQQRSRTVIVEPRNGGKQCDDRLQRRYCTLPPCPRPRYVDFRSIPWSIKY